MIDLKENWDVYFPPIALAINITKSSTHGLTPYQVMFGTQCPTTNFGKPLEIEFVESDIERYFKEIGKFILNTHDSIVVSLENFKRKMAIRY